jgi:hypothetical protein
MAHATAQPFTAGVEVAQLDVTEAQGEPDIKPDRLLDNLGREAVAVMTDVGHHRWLRLKVTDPMALEALRAARIGWQDRRRETGTLLAPVADMRLTHADVPMLVARRPPRHD